MTRDEAQAHARALSDGDREHHYFAREAGDGWEVERVAAPPGGVKPTGTSIAARPRPEADDPRQSLERQVGLFGAGGF